MSSNVVLLVMGLICIPNVRKIHVESRELSENCVSVCDDVRQKLNVFTAPGPAIFKSSAMQCYF